MAHTVEFLQKGNRRFALLTITQISVAAATEETVTDARLEGVWKMLRLQADLVSGTGTTINPVFGWQAAPAGSHKVGYQARQTAAQVDEQPVVAPIFAIPTGGSLSYRPVVDAAADNVVSSTLILEEV